jgi:hypothetical protein
MLRAIELTTIQQLLPGSPEDQERDHLRCIEAHMAFLTALAALPDAPTLDLRFVHKATRPGQVRVGLLLDCPDDVLWEIRDLLCVLHPWYGFETPAETTAVFQDPFPVHEVVEIRRRSAWIPLGEIRRFLPKVVGFASERPDAAAVAEGDAVFFVYPFLLDADCRKRLCEAMIGAGGDCCVSIRLRGGELATGDEEWLRRRIQACEREARRGGEGLPVSDLAASQTRLLFDQCSTEYYRLQDAACLLQVLVAGSGPLPRQILAALGIGITPHAGHPDLPYNARPDSPLAGGYCLERGPTLLESWRRRDFVPRFTHTAPQSFAHMHYLSDITQACAAFRFPLPLMTEFPGVDTLRFTPLAAPRNLPADGLALGEYRAINNWNPVRIASQDRLRHLYLVGQTGTGKSTLLKTMMLQDIAGGRGFAFFDPHGDLIDELVPLIPPEHRHRVRYLDPADRDFPFGINLLQTKGDQEKDFVIDYMLETIDMLYDLNQVGGPMFEMYFRNILMLLIHQPAEKSEARFVNVLRLLGDEDYRKSLVQDCTNHLVRQFWEKEAPSARGDLSIENITPYFTSKLARFLYNHLLYPIFSQGETTFDMRRIMDQEEILLVNLRKGSLGALNSRFLGMMLVGEVMKATFARSADANKAALPPFYLYVDEFQNLASSTFRTLLSEARKYGLGLVLANQYLTQLRDAGHRQSADIAASILGNVGTIITFRLGGEDAELFAKVFGGNLLATDFMSLPNYRSYVRLLNRGSITNPFDMRTTRTDPPADSLALTEIRNWSRAAIARSLAEVLAQTAPQADVNPAGSDEDRIETELRRLFGD